MEAVGLREMQDYLSGLVVEFEQELPGLDDPLHRACCEAYRAVSSEIPKDTGALVASLTRYRDRAQFFKADADGYEFGSTLPQARFQASRLPEVSLTPLLTAFDDAVSDALDDGLAPDGGQ